MLPGKTREQSNFPRLHGASAPTQTQRSLANPSTGKPTRHERELAPPSPAGGTLLLCVVSTIRGDPTPCLGCRRRAASGGSRERAASHRLHCRSRAPRAVPRGSCARCLNPLFCPNYTMGESQLGHTATLLLPLVPSPPPQQAVLRPRCQVNHRPAPRLGYGAAVG